MLNFIICFVTAGFVIGILPEVAKLFGNRVAGYLPLIPIGAVAGYIALAHAKDAVAVREVAMGTMPALMPYAVFCAIVALTVNKWGYGDRTTDGNRRLGSEHHSSAFDTPTNLRKI